MKLISLRTQGFKRLRNHNFNFTDGLNVIVGDNAAGKSTLLQAIECALYGAAVVPGKKEHMITWGQKTWKIALEFAVGDAVYELTRSKSTAKLVHVGGGDNGGDKIIANGATPVTQAIEELLGLSAKDYNLFMQSKQGETSGVLTFGAAALNRKVEAFSGISTIDDVQQFALEDFRTAKAKIEALSFDENEKVAAGNQRLLQQQEVRYLGTQVEAAVQEFEAAPKPDSVLKPDSDPDILQAQLDKVARLRQRLDQAKRDHVNAEQRQGEAAARLADLAKPADKSQLEADLAAALEVESKARDEAKSLEREMDRQINLWNAMETAAEKMNTDRELDAIGEELAAQVDFKGEAEAKLHHDQSLLTLKDEKIRQLTDLKKDAKCPTCNTKLTEHDPEKLAEELEQLKAEKSELAQWVKEHQAEVNKYTDFINRLEREMESTQANEQKYQAFYDELEALGINMETADSPIEVQMEEANTLHSRAMEVSVKARQKLDDSETEWKRYTKAEREAANEAQAAKEAADAVNRASESLAAAMEQGEPSQELITECRQLWKDYHQLISQVKLDYAEAQNAVTLAKQAFEAAERELKACEKTVESLNQRAEEIKTLKVTADKAGRLSKFLSERRAGYLQEVWDAVLASASKQVNLASRGMVSRLAFKDGDFFFEEDGILAPVSSASGAQKAHIGVAVRIGLSRALYGKDALLIFDEPTESMREHHAIGLSSSLAGAASQCLLITHREQDQDLAANLLEVA